MISLSLPRMACTLICLTWTLAMPLRGQEIPGVPPESEYYYRIHYEKVEAIMKVLDLAEREKRMTDFMKSVNPKSKILQYMPSYFTQIAEEYQKAGKADQARALQTKIAQWFPNTGGNPMAPIAEAFKAKDFAKTLDLGEKLYATNPDKQLAYLLFESAVATNNPAKAEGYAVKVVDEFGAKDGVKAAAWLMRYYAQQKNGERAASYASQMVSAFPGDATPAGWTAAAWNSESVIAHNLTGDVAYARRDYAGAIQAYRNALKHDPNNDYSYYRIGYSQWQLQDLDTAQESFAKAVVLGKTYAARARQYLEQIYKPRHNNTLDGLDQLLAKAKAEVNP